MDDRDYNPFLINYSDELVSSPMDNFASASDSISVSSSAPTSDSDPISLPILKEQSETPAPAASFEEAKLTNQTNSSDNSSDFKSTEFDWDLGPIKEAVYLIETDKIKPNPYQPRRNFDELGLKELAESIREYGILQPLIVVKIEKEVPSGTSVEYQLIAGERRLKAAQMIGLERVPAVIRQPLEERQKLEAAIIENIQRLDLNPLETARAFAKLIDEFGLAQREIAQKIGKSREFVSNTLRLLGLPSEAQRALQEGKITESHARVLLTIQNPEKQRALLGEIISRHLTVRETEILARRILGILSLADSQNISLAGLGDPFEIELKAKLEEVLGTKVEIKKKGSRGKITINFFSEEELNEILRKICRE